MNICKHVVPVGLAAFLGLLSVPASATVTPTGVMEVCKTSDATNPVTGTFSFRIVQGATVITRTIPVNACSGPITLAAGEATVTEAAVSGVGVNLITALGPGGIVRLVRSDLGDRTATLQIVAGDSSLQTLVTFRNFRTPTGYIEVCKDAAPGTTFPAGTSFTFSISGRPGLVTVPVGACSGPILVPAGSVTVTETARPDAVLVDIVALPPARRVSLNLGAQSAVFTIVGGDISTQTVARFINRPATGQLKICKVAGEGIALSRAFTISAGGDTYTVPAGPAAEGGFCVVDGTFPVGTQVTVQETIPTGVQLQSVVAAPADRLVSSNLANGTALVRIGTGFTEVVFTNRIPPPPPPPVTGQLKICKIAGPGITVGTLYTITATPAGGTAQTYTVPAGPASEGGYCVLDGTFNVGTQVTVDEVVPAGNVVASITVEPSGRGGGTNLGAGSVVATIGTGFTEVTFTNRTPPPTTFQVCKAAGTGVFVGEPFTFDIRLGTATRTVTVNAGTVASPTCSPNISVAVGTLVRVTERAITGVTPNVTFIERTVNEPSRFVFTNTRAVVQNCSPGYFKNHIFTSLTGSGITLSTLGFGGAYASLTLQAGLEANGGGLNQLARFAASAYLNLLASGVPAATAQSVVRALVLAGNVAALTAYSDDTPCTLTLPNKNQ